ENQEVMVVNAAHDRPLANIGQVMLDYHLWLAGNQANYLFVKIAVPRGSICDSLRKRDRVWLRLDRPFAVIDNVIEAEHTIFIVVGFAQNAYADFEESATSLSLAETEALIVGRE